MKLELTKKYIETIISSGVTKGIQKLPEINKEIEEVERLARIGSALEKWFSHFNSIYDHEKDYPYSTVEELLEWQKERVGDDDL